jgi:hypothetical protein
MAEMTLEQRRAMAMAAARLRLQGSAAVATDEFVGPDKITRGNILPLGRNERTGELSLALPQSLDNIYNLATGKTPIQEADPITGEVHSSLGAIKGGMDTAMTVAGAPPAKMAVERAGGLIPKMPERAAPPAPKPAIVPATEWEGIKNSAYKAVDDSGIKYSQDGFNRMVDQIETLAKAKKLNPLRHPKANSVIEEMKTHKGSTPTLTELDQWRQVIRRDVQGDEAEGFFRDTIIDSIDDFIDGATVRDVVSGDPAAAGTLIHQARQANAKFRKTELMEDVLQRAKNQAAKAGSGGNVDNAIRQQVDSILRSKKAKFFSKAERVALQKVVDGDTMQNFARLLGKMSPEGNGLMAMLQTLGGVFSSGMTVPLAIGGFAAKRYSDAATRNNLDDVTRLIQGGGQ